MEKNQNSGTLSPLPQYKCHKIVHALKIIKIVYDDDIQDGGGATLYPEDSKGYAPFKVDSEFIRKHLSEKEAKEYSLLEAEDSQGYYVVYEDGYKSWSPAEAFEAGYTLVNDSTLTDEERLNVLSQVVDKMQSGKLSTDQGTKNLVAIIEARKIK